MTSYIINPSTLYWFNVLSSLKDLATVLACFCGVGTAACAFVWVYNYIEWIEYERERHKKYAHAGRRATISLGIVTIVLIAAAIFLPSQETSVEILITQNLTHENINWTVSQVKEIVDYIVKSLGR